MAGKLVATRDSLGSVVSKLPWPCQAPGAQVVQHPCTMEAPCLSATAGSDIFHFVFVCVLLFPEECGWQTGSHKYSETRPDGINTAPSGSKCLLLQCPGDAASQIQPFSFSAFLSLLLAGYPFTATSFLSAAATVSLPQEASPQVLSVSPSCRL